MTPSSWRHASVSRTKSFPNEGYAKTGATESLCFSDSKANWQVSLQMNLTSFRPGKVVERLSYLLTASFSSLSRLEYRLSSLEAH